MTESPQKSEDKTKIIGQIADLSKLLGMIPSDDSTIVIDPVSHNSMELSKWFSDARKSFNNLSILIDRALDLKLQ